MMPADSECCDTETCLSKMEIFDTPQGKQHELQRRAECNDDIPGNCYNIDGTASDISADGSTDCCTQTCSTCGSELSSGAVWEVCTSNVPGTMTASCGRLSRYDQEDFVCDFTKCPEDSYWGMGNEHIYKYMGIESELWKPVSDGDGSIVSVSQDENSAASISSVANIIFGIIGNAILFDWIH